MSRKHRHRDNKVKKMHTIIGDYAKHLDAIGSIPEVKAVITGVISPHKSEYEEMTFQYFTDSGLKLLAKTTQAIQEVFLTTDAKQRVLDELHRLGILQERMKKMRKSSGKPANKKQAKSNAFNPFDNERHERHQANAPKEKPTTLKDLLTPDQLAKLQNTSTELKEQERVTKEKKRQAEIDRRTKEQKALENDMEYLLKTSKMNWKDFK